LPDIADGGHALGLKVGLLVDPGELELAVTLHARQLAAYAAAGSGQSADLIRREVASHTDSFRLSPVRVPGSAQSVVVSHGHPRGAKLGMNWAWQLDLLTGKRPRRRRSTTSSTRSRWCSGRHCR